MFDRFERFSFAMADINKSWHKLAAEEMQKCGLKGAHAVYLLALLQHPDGLTTPQLCELCGKDKADASRMMRTMEEQGLVCKEGNRYGGIFLLTAQGMEAAAQMHSRACTAVDYAGRDLTDEQRDTFYTALEIIRQRLRELRKDGIPEK